MLIDKLKESFDKNVLQDKESSSKKYIYPSAFRHTIAFIVDFMILGVVRIAIITCSLFFVNSYRQEFIHKFSALFGDISNFDLAVDIHLRMLLKSKFGTSIIVLIVLCTLIGVAYQTYMFQSKICATYGRRLVSIYISKENGDKMTTLESFIRSILTYVPWILPLFALHLWFNYRGWSIFLIVLSAFWGDTFLFSGRKIGIHDIIMRTVPRIGKVN